MHAWNWKNILDFCLSICYAKCQIGPRTKQNKSTCQCLLDSAGYSKNFQAYANFFYFTFLEDFYRII